MIPGKLGFDFEQAKKHLSGVDPRFKTLFERLKCKPFENLQAVDPFRCVGSLAERTHSVDPVAADRCVPLSSDNKSPG